MIMMTTEIKVADWNIEAMTGYEPKTTFYTDFSIADAFGGAAVRDTYERAFNEWKSDVVHITELAMVLNWKSWELYDRGDYDLSRLYASLWEQADTWCMDNLQGDDLDYYIRATD